MNFAKNTINFFFIFTQLNVTNMYKGRARDQPYCLCFLVYLREVYQALYYLTYTQQSLQTVHIPKPSITPMTPLCINIARSQHLMNVQLQFKKIWKSCYLGRSLLSSCPTMQLLFTFLTCYFPISISILFSTLVSDHSFHSILFSTGQLMQQSIHVPVNSCVSCNC